MLHTEHYHGAPHGESLLGICLPCPGMIGSLYIGIAGSSAVNSAGADGLIYGGTHLIGVQALAVAATAVWTVLATGLILVALDKLLGGLRSGLSPLLSACQHICIITLALRMPTHLHYHPRSPHANTSGSSPSHTFPLISLAWGTWIGVMMSLPSGTRKARKPMAWIKRSTGRRHMTCLRPPQPHRP